MKKLLRGLAALAAVLFATAASAQEGRVQRGGGGKVAEHYHIDPNGCRSGRPAVVRVTQQPRLGRLSFQTRTVKIAGGFFGGPCAGRDVRATVGVYRAGQRAGRDEFAYTFSFPDAPRGTGGAKRIAVVVE